MKHRAYTWKTKTPFDQQTITDSGPHPKRFVLTNTVHKPTHLSDETTPWFQHPSHTLDDTGRITFAPMECRVTKDSIEPALDTIGKCQCLRISPEHMYHSVRLGLL